MTITNTGRIGVSLAPVAVVGVLGLSASSRGGDAANRRMGVKILVNRGLKGA
jgi:hypothetical protein